LLSIETKIKERYGMNYERIFREVSINAQSFKSSTFSLKIPKRAWWKIKFSFFSELFFDNDYILIFLEGEPSDLQKFAALGAVHQMQFIFNFRLFS